MGFEIVDGYLFGDPIPKPDVVSALLADRSDAAAAAPFYRALEAIGARAADEAFVALRLVLAGRSLDDDAVKRLRGLAAAVRAARAGAASAAAAAAASEARAAYFQELETGDAGSP